MAMTKSRMKWGTTLFISGVIVVPSYLASYYVANERLSNLLAEVFGAGVALVFIGTIGYAVAKIRKVI
jgi:hypothetical protein